MTACLLRFPSHALAPREAIPRHIHAEPYAAVVLEGGYEEAGEAGRFRVEAGDVLVHAAFSAHWDHAPKGARLLNLPLPADLPVSTVGRLEDPDLVIRLAQRDPKVAGEALLALFRPLTQKRNDQADSLAETLSGSAGMDLGAWSAAQGIARQTAFRWFRAAYGVSPTRYRVEARARRAWRAITTSRDDLAHLAAALGYADQAHMTREVSAFTGRTPGAWRAAKRLQPLFKTPGD